MHRAHRPGLRLRSAHCGLDEAPQASAWDRRHFKQAARQLTDSCSIFITHQRTAHWAVTGSLPTLNRKPHGLCSEDLFHQILPILLIIGRLSLISTQMCHRHIKDCWINLPFIFLINQLVQKMPGNSEIIYQSQSKHIQVVVLFKDIQCIITYDKEKHRILTFGIRPSDQSKTSSIKWQLSPDWSDVQLLDSVHVFQWLCVQFKISKSTECGAFC